jgi:hypothetical protein
MFISLENCGYLGCRYNSSNLYLVEIFCHPHLELAQGPTQPPVQWILGALVLGIKQPKHKANDSTQSIAVVKNVYLHSPIHDGMVLSYA